MFGASGPASSCECGPNADWFVQELFSDCIYTTWELVAFWIGMSSVLFWIVAQLPQFISNLKNQTAEALSPWFLLQWLAGDSFNLLGCILTGDQLATQTFTATYFIFADCVIISQLIYYNMRERERLALDEKDHGSSSLVPEKIAKGFLISEFQNRLPKLTIVAPDLSEDLEVSHDAQNSGHQYHQAITSVTGRSGGSKISHVMHSPRALHNSNMEYTSKASHTGTSAWIPGSPGTCRAEGSSFQLNPNAQYHPVSYVAGRSGASMIAHSVHSPKSPHDPHVDHFKKASQALTLSSSGTSPRREGSTDIDFRVNNSNQCHPSGTSKMGAEAFLERSDRTGQFQSMEERNKSLARSRICAARGGKIPEFGLEQLFPSANAMKRHLRRLVNHYDLECGAPSASRLTIHHVTSLGKHKFDKQIRRTLSSKLGSQLKKRPIRAAACLASLLTVKTGTNYFQKSGTLGPGISISGMSSTVRIGRKLLLICDDIQRPWWLKSFGSCLGWGSSGLYFGSRFSQIAMNYQRRSAEGLSLAMLSFAILANSCMGLSILMRTKSLDDLAEKAPWLLGSMGTVSLDIFLLLQAKYLDARSTKLAQTVADERTYLLA